MKKQVIGVIVGIVIIIAALAGILYYTTDLFKTPDQLFYRHLANDSQLLGKASYSDMVKELKKDQEETKEVAGEIAVSVKSDDADVKEVANILEKAKITYNMKKIGKEQKVQNDITLQYDGKEIVTLNTLQNKEQYGIKIAEAYDKYVTVENNNLKALFQKLGVDEDNVPDKIEMMDYNEVLTIDQKTLDHIEKTYSEVIQTNIPKDCYSIEKNSKAKVDSTEITTNSYKLELTETQLKTVLVKVLETLKDDNTTLDLIVEKYNKIAKSYTMLDTETTTQELTKQELIQSIEESLTELNQTTTADEVILTMIVYATKDSKAKIEIIVKDIMKMDIEMIKENDKENVIVKCENEEVNIDVMMSYQEEGTTQAMVTIESEGTAITISTKQEEKESKNVTVEDLTQDNSVKLNDMTENEITQLVQTIYTNVLQVLPQKMQLLGISL